MKTRIILITLIILLMIGFKSIPVPTVTACQESEHVETLKPEERLAVMYSRSDRALGRLPL